MRLKARLPSAVGCAEPPDAWGQRVSVCEVTRRCWGLAGLVLPLMGRDLLYALVPDIFFLSVLWLVRLGSGSCSLQYTGWFSPGIFGQHSKQDSVCVCACVSMHRYLGRELRKLPSRHKPAPIPDVLKSLLLPCCPGLRNF